MTPSVSVRVFAVFSCLTATTVALGATAFLGLRDLRRAGSQIETVKDFQIQIGRLELLNRARKPSHLRAGDPAFEEEFRRTEALADRVARLRAQLPRGMQAQVGTLREHLGYVRTAFGELFTQYALGEELTEEIRRFHQEVFARLEAEPPATRLALVPIVHRLAQTAERVRGGPLPSAEMRTMVAAIRRLGNPTVAALCDRLLSNAEKAYLNGLGVADREKFLTDTSRRFSELSAQATAAIAEGSRVRQQQVTRAVIAVVFSSGLLTLLLWRASMVYLGAFLRDIHQAVEFIRAGRYDYPVPRMRRDEFGALTLFLREVAAHLEASLRRVQASEDRFRSLVEDISDWVWELDPEGRFSYSSPVVRRVLGVEPSDVMGKFPWDLMHSDDATRGADDLRRSLEQRQPARAVEASFRLPSGSIAVLEASWQPVVGEDGEFRGLRGISRDVTERKRGEEEQARLRSQLFQAQKMEAIGTLTGGIAHDFNNLLQSVSGYTEMLLRGKPEADPDVPRLRTIEKATWRAAELTRQLLVFGRKVENRAEALHLNDEVVQVQDLLGRTIPKMVSIRTRLAPGLWNVEADAAQLEQVLMNLAVNAKDAMPEGGILEFATANVQVEADEPRGESDLPPGRYVRLSVSDTGHGMDATILEHIFEPFFTTKDVGKGTGLGLAIVYGIVQKHRGHIRCQSSPERGTIFHVYLPALPDGVELPAPPRPTGGPVPGKGGTETVLLVDDEESLRTLGDEILGGAGYTTLGARSGEEALELLRSGRPIDLAVLDLNMPGMGGLECLREMRRCGLEIRVLVASGYPPGPLHSELEGLGARTVLRKPYRADELLAAVRQTLGHTD